MMFNFSDITSYIQSLNLASILFPIVRALVILIFGYFAVIFIRRSVMRVCEGKLSQHLCMLFSNIIFYAGTSLTIIMILQALGFNLSTLLGAAGVAGVAIGFASQTSVSNIISGIFLLFEQSFSVGDTILAAGTSGVIESIDLFSVKVRTFDNEMVRIPSELLLKQQVTNITYFDTRRIVFSCEVLPDQDIAAVKKVIDQVITDTKGILSHPQPVILFKEVKQIEYSNVKRIVLLVRVWAKREDVFSVKNAFVPNLKELCDKENIDIIITHGN